MIRIACIGAGVWGINLVRNFADLGALYAVCDSDGDAVKRCAEAYPQSRYSDSYDQLLADPQVDAVAIATPAGTHAALATRALAAGKDVFVEKPLALTLAEGQAVAELADRHSRILMVGHLLQYHPAVRALHNLIVKGELGKLQYVYSTRLNIGRFRREENILWSFAPHDLSTILMLTGQMPETVQASGGTYLQQGIPDVTVTNLAFPDGVTAHVFVSWLHPLKEQKLVVIGSRKMAVLDDLAADKLTLYSHQVNWIDHAPVAQRAKGEPVAVAMQEPLTIECRHFLDCVRRRRRPQTDGREALRVLSVLQAAQDSLNRGGAAVHLDGSGAPSHAPAPPAAPAGVFIHPTAIVDQPSEILSGTKIWQFSHVLAGCRLGADCNVGQNVVIGPNVTVGNRVKIQNNVSVYEGVTLEDYVFCGPSMVFTNVINPRSAIPRKSEIKATLVRTGASLGANCTVLCGITVGRHAFIGAGAVVTSSVPDHALMLGNPARRAGWVCQCGATLKPAKGKARCKACQTCYRIDARNGCRLDDDVKAGWPAGRARTRRARR